MLRFLRKYSSSAGIKILYGVLAGLFVLWGVGAISGDKRQDVARVHGQAISRRDLDQATAALTRRYEDALRGRNARDLLRNMNLPGQALNQLIEEALMRHEAVRLGIMVTDAEVDETVLHMPELQENGRFDRDRLAAVLRSA